jgi:hypothetical protein
LSYEEEINGKYTKKGMEKNKESPQRSPETLSSSPYFINNNSLNPLSSPRRNSRTFSPSSPPSPMLLSSDYQPNNKNNNNNNSNNNNNNNNNYLGV